MPLSEDVIAAFHVGKTRSNVRDGRGAAEVDGEAIEYTNNITRRIKYPWHQFGAEPRLALVHGNEYVIQCPLCGTQCPLWLWWQMPARFRAGLPAMGIGKRSITSALVVSRLQPIHFLVANISIVGAPLPSDN